ncbi:MAG: DUF3460 family protein [Gallionella sp.]
MSKDYVSEFAGFMNKFLEDNPEVVKAQQVGREIFWKDKHQPAATDTNQTKSASKNSQT